MNAEERKILWLLAEVVEFEGKKYKAVHLPGLVLCDGCAHAKADSACLEFKYALSETSGTHTCGDRIWKRAK